jgi:hypothetical protein
MVRRLPVEGEVFHLTSPFIERVYVSTLAVDALLCTDKRGRARTAEWVQNTSGIGKILNKILDEVN